MKNSEIAALDKLWAEKIKEVGVCERCGKRSYLNAHHIYSRSNRSVRWEIINGICLCSGCHTLCTDSAHKAPADFIDWVKDYRGKIWWEKLVVLKNEVAKNQDFETIKKELIPQCGVGKIGV